MKRWGILLPLLLFSACERFPTHVDDGVQLPAVSISHTATEYVEAEPLVEGLVADKVNILTFDLKADNCTLLAVEFFGSVRLSGPPDSVSHAIHFRSDTLLEHTADLNYPFEQFQLISQGTSYSLKRPVFPTNEYAPFENGQGQVLSVCIREIWAHDTAGVIHRLALDE